MYFIIMFNKGCFTNESVSCLYFDRMQIRFACRCSDIISIEEQIILRNKQTSKCCQQFNRQPAVAAAVRLHGLSHSNRTMKTIHYVQRLLRIRYEHMFVVGNFSLGRWPMCLYVVRSGVASARERKLLSYSHSHTGFCERCFARSHTHAGALRRERNTRTLLSHSQYLLTSNSVKLSAFFLV